MDDEIDESIVDEQRKLAEKFAMGGFLLLITSVSIMLFIAYLSHHGDSELETIRKPMRAAGKVVYDHVQERLKSFRGNATVLAANSTVTAP
eukprot:CAMPEP_0196729542 /NCGR_PEP_ID=MMETSP1091-20130531/9911_1 /TAXON_ID=302021 /ORGANISM="Rhodomonas sp., Strain CCMP768" /LENGTH=90 /DNA_ID=CAMNT_0042072443 /DNA_START=155 /DNA_END=427 /DNA_ORIENTATION=+